MLKIYKSVLSKIKKAKKIAAIHCISAETAISFLKMGFDLVTLSTDMGLLKKAADKEQKKIKNFIQKPLK